jgi:aryl-alcohol dehydrogenase-like predicted oxidoreductase
LDYIDLYQIHRFDHVSVFDHSGDYILYWSYHT